jgi:glutathione S-transferase
MFTRFYSNGKWNQVPLLITPNGDQVYNTKDIGKYLELHYPSPTLNAVNSKLDQLLLDYDPISDISFSLSIMDLYHAIDKADKPYFLESRPLLLGTSIEEFTKDLDGNLKLYHEKTLNLGDLFDKSDYLNGNEPGFYDYLLAGRIQYIRLISPNSYEKLIVNHPKKSILNWFERMLNLFDGYMRNANGVKN